MSSRVAAIHKARLEQVVAEAENLGGAAYRIAQMATEVLHRGGRLQADPQLSFIVGALMRLTKDVGVISQLQAEGVGQRARGNGFHEVERSN